MFEIKNNELTVKINEMGAEITSVHGNKNNIEYIWNDEAWPKHAPILFPAIGRSDNDSYLINGKEKHMDQHGFAANQLFKVIDQKENEISMALSENNETLLSYPFNFRLIVKYTLQSKKLIVEFKVINPNFEDLSFSLGFHPAFNIPVVPDEEFEDYNLTFSPSESELKQYEIVKAPFPYRSGKVIDFAEKNGFSLKRSLFQDGLIIFDNEINEVNLGSSKHNINIEMSSFSNLCIWTKEDMELPYLCIEPFYGLPDKINTKQELLTKEGNYLLDGKSSKEFTCTIEFN